MQKIFSFFKKEAMLTIAVLAAIVSLFISKPDLSLLRNIDWKTLATLFMLLSVLDGFKKENLFKPLITLSGKIKTLTGLSFFLVFSVFFSSMFVTNDVSLIIFVPLTIMLFRSCSAEKYLLPILSMENIAAIRGSLLTPFGSPQNLFLYARSNIDAPSFFLMMLPLWLGSAVLLSVFILFLYRKNVRAEVSPGETGESVWLPENKKKRIAYISLFILIITAIITRTAYWPAVTAVVVTVLLIFDREVFRRVDYALILTFFCFFVFSSSLTSNEKISALLSTWVTGHEYISGILISQIISNVPAAIVMWPFTSELRPLIYGLDSAGLVSVIGSLASVINLRLYTSEYPGKSLDFIKVFEIVSLIFFAIIFIPQTLLL